MPLFPQNNRTGYRLYRGLCRLSTIPGAVRWRIRPQDERLELALGSVRMIVMGPKRILILNQDHSVTLNSTSVPECLALVKKTLDCI